MSTSPTPPTPHIISGAAIHEVMESIGAGFSSSILIRDDIYSLPSFSFIRDEYSHALATFLKQMHISEYVVQENDCDDYALASTFFMSYLHHNTKNKIVHTGVAFGEFYYERDLGGLHAINVAIVRMENNKIKVVFYEPRTYSIVGLSSKEVKSCIYWRF